MPSHPPPRVEADRSNRRPQSAEQARAIEAVNQPMQTQQRRIGNMEARHQQRTSTSEGQQRDSTLLFRHRRFSFRSSVFRTLLPMMLAAAMLFHSASQLPTQPLVVNPATATAATTFATFHPIFASAAVVGSEAQTDDAVAAALDDASTDPMRMHAIGRPMRLQSDSTTVTLSSLSDQLTAQAALITVMQATIESQSSVLANLTARLTASETNSYLIVFTLNTQIASLQSRVQQLENADKSLTKLIGDLSDTSETKIASVQADVATLAARVTATNSSVAAQIAALEATDSTVLGTLANDAQLISNLTGVVSLHSQQIASLQASNSTTATTITAIQAAASSLDSRFTAAVTSAMAQIAALQTSNTAVLNTLAVDAQLLANHSLALVSLATVESAHIVGDASTGLNTTFLNGWTSFNPGVVGDRVPKFWRDRDLVHLEGMAANSDDTLVIYTITEKSPFGGGTVTTSIVSENGYENEVNEIAIFQLPVGYRPNQTETAGTGRIFDTDGTDLRAALGITVDGYVMVRSGDLTRISLDGISFRAG